MRTELAAEIGGVRDSVATSVTNTFLAAHPEWIERYGDRARTHGVQDARHHIDFLRAAVELDDPTVYRDYALWCRDLLSARGISVQFLIENLGAIRVELAAQVSAEAAEAVKVATRTALEALSAGDGSTWASEGQLSPECRLYLAAAVGGRRAAALAVVRGAIRGGDSPVDVYVDIFQRSLYEVGRRWQTTGLTIAEEHMATATTQFILGLLHEEQPPRTGGGEQTAVVTGVANERHMVGACIVANVLEEAGWDVRLMGTDLPADGIVTAIRRTRASLVAISVTMSGHVTDARELIGQIRRDCPNPPRIIVGGAAFLRDPELWRTVGADGFAPDARGVAELAVS